MKLKLRGLAAYRLRVESPPIESRTSSLPVERHALANANTMLGHPLPARWFHG